MPSKTRPALRMNGCKPALACALILGLTNLAIAKIAVTSLPGTLSIDGWQFRAEDGQLGLARVPSRRWDINAPTITDPTGMFVSTDPDGKTPTVHLVQDKGPNTKWAFEFLEDFTPSRTSGTEGFRFRAKVAEGPFKGWYIAVDPLPAGAAANPDLAPRWRPLKLVQDPRLAARLQYITGFDRGQNSVHHHTGDKTVRGSAWRSLWRLGLPVALLCAVLIGLTRRAKGFPNGGR